MKILKALSSLCLLISSTSVLLVPVPQSGARSPRGRGRGSRWWGIARVGEPSNLIQNTIRGVGAGLAGSYMEPAVQGVLRKKQSRLVRENRGVLESIAKGATDAIHECCRETSFLYALTSAAVTHAVVKSCSEGTIESCTCDYRLHNKYNRFGLTGLEESWKWGSCSDNIEFGYKFARDFVDAGERAKDLRGSVNLHNNEAGRAHVQLLMRRHCKCHGMSGSCTMKTCWLRQPHLRDVSNALKERFDGATRVLRGNAGSLRDIGPLRDVGRKFKYKVQLKPYNADHKPPSKTDLVFYEDSPSFCERDRRYGLSGTSSRPCNVTSLGVDGCDLMCCGRGHEVRLQTITTRCNCRFKWCCEVTCDNNCTSTHALYTCK